MSALAMLHPVTSERTRKGATPFRFRTAILATCLAVLAVGLAGAVAFHDAMPEQAAAKGDLPPIPRSDARYVTVETRHDGFSVLHRVRVGNDEAFDLAQ